MSTFPASHTSITCTALGFSWPDGTEVFDGLQAAFGTGRTGLIGVNGSGKSTLLKLIAGELNPGEGAIRVAGDVGYLPQNVTLDTGLRVDVVLGIAETRAALHAIEAGDASEANFTAVGDDWDVEERAIATLDQLGLGHIGLDRTIGEVSGGESVLLRLAALLLGRPGVLLLDEPTNNPTCTHAAGCTRPSRPGRECSSWSATTVNSSTWSTRSPTSGRARSSGTGATSPRTRRPWPSSRRRRSAWCASPRPI